MQDKTYSHVIEIVTPDGIPATAWLGDLYVHDAGVPFLEKCDQPIWHIQRPGHPETTIEWLPYRTYSGSHSRTKGKAITYVEQPGPRGAGRCIDSRLSPTL